VGSAAFNKLLYMQQPISLLEKKAKSTAPSCIACYFSVLVSSASGSANAVSMESRRTRAAAAVVAWSAGVVVVVVVAATVLLPYLRVTLSLLAQYY
jgi:hypothetical protein